MMTLPVINVERWLIRAAMVLALLGLSYGSYRWHRAWIHSIAREAAQDELTYRQQLMEKADNPLLELRMPAPTFAINDVIDADTLKVDVQLVDDVWLKNASLRIRDVDAVELVEPLGREAAAYVREFVKGDGVATLEIHIEKKRDKYGRLLGDVRQKDGKWLSEILLEKNYARPYYN